MFKGHAARLWVPRWAVLGALLLLPTPLGQSVLGQSVAPLPSAPPAATPPAASPPPSPQTPQRQRSAAPSGLDVLNAGGYSEAEQATLRAVFEKARPATLRIEGCPPQNCVRPDGVGSAVLISADGLALTAYHVLEGDRPEDMSAVTLDRKRFAFQVLGYDDQADLALIQVAVPPGTPFLNVARGPAVVGEAALAIGNSSGFLIPKVGRLLALDARADRPGQATFARSTVESSIPISPGDSGGPILNLAGEVIGISSYVRLANAEAVFLRGASPVVRGHAVPVSQGDATLQAVQAGEKRDAPVIGIGIGSPLDELVDITEAGFARLSELMKLGRTAGAFFTSVSPDSPAARAGLQPLKLNADFERVSGDIVTEVNGRRIVNFSEFQYTVRSYRPGDTITLTVLRGEQTLKVPVTLIGRSLIRN